ncbi:MAG: LamG-like jellyroll fold domain-containing protein [Chlamydiota bacterium]|nr:LamG-like jellyroll fold domain-containing protein [Chlamydiota bacterium]
MAGDLGYFPSGTISFWMNSTAVQNWRNPFSTRLFGWDDNIRFEESSSGEFAVGALGMGVGTYTSALEAMRWYHVVYAWDENNGYGYLDGELIFTTPHPDPESSAHPNLEHNAGYYKERCLHFDNVAVGNGYSSESERFWKGYIDEFRIYNRVLSADEVTQLAQKSTASLILHYNFDADEGSTVTDQSGQGHHATLYNHPTYTEDGMIQGSFSFNGSDVVLGGNLGYHPSGSVSFWMNADVVENWRNPFSSSWADWDDNIRFEEASSGEFGIGALGMGAHTLSTGLESNRWYHVVYAWDLYHAEGYFNGKRIFTSIHPDPLDVVHVGYPYKAGYYRERCFQLRNIAIGNGYSGNPERFWKGRIDDVRIYDGPVDESDVQNIYMEPRLYRYLKSLQDLAATGLLINQDAGSTATLMDNAQALMGLLNKQDTRQALQILDFFDDYFYAKDAYFNGFEEVWNVISGDPTLGAAAESSNAVLLHALNYYSQLAGTDQHEYQSLAQGLLSWLSQRAQSGDTIVASSLGQMYAALEPYQAEGVITQSLTQLETDFNFSADYEHELADIIQGAVVFDDTSGFLNLDNFADSEYWEYDPSVLVEAYSATTMDDYIDVPISAQLLTAWNLLQGQISTDLSGIKGQLSNLFLFGVLDLDGEGVPTRVSTSDALYPALGPSIQALFYFWDFNSFGTGFTFPYNPVSSPYVEIESVDHTIQTGGTAHVNVRWNNINTTGQVLRIQLNNWNVSPGILAYQDFSITSSSGRQSFSVNLSSGSNTGKGCTYWAVVGPSGDVWSSVQALDMIGDDPSYGFDKGMAALSLMAIQRATGSYPSAETISLEIADDLVALLADEPSNRKGWRWLYNIQGEVKPGSDSNWNKTPPPSAVGLLTLVGHLRNPALSTERYNSYLAAAYEVADFLLDLQITNGVSDGFWGGYQYSSGSGGGSASKSTATDAGSTDTTLLESTMLYAHGEYLENAGTYTHTDNPGPGRMLGRNSVDLGDQPPTETMITHCSTEHTFLAGHALLQFGDFLNDNGLSGSTYYNAGREALLWAIQPISAPQYGLWNSNHFVTGVDWFEESPPGSGNYIPHYNPSDAFPQTHNLWAFMILKADASMLGINAELYNPIPWVLSNFQASQSYKGWQITGCRNGSNATQNINSELSNGLFAGLVLSTNYSTAQDFMESALVLQRFFGGYPSIVGPLDSGYPDNFRQTNIGYALEWAAALAGANFLDVMGVSDTYFSGFLISRNFTEWNGSTLGDASSTFIQRAVQYAENSIDTFGGLYDGTFISWDSLRESIKVVAAGSSGAGKSKNHYMGDPTFIQASERSLDQEHQGREAFGLFAQIKVPYTDALVRANVPVFGLAYGEDFKEYRVEFGEGTEPKEWHVIKRSSDAVLDLDINAEELFSGDKTVFGNLATWDTGLTNYVYGDEFPAGHPINLKGSYTLRLVVENHQGVSVEDRILLEVGRVVSNIYGGLVKSTDEQMSLQIPEHALNDAFLVMGIQPVTGDSPVIGEGYQTKSGIYEVRPAGAVFTRHALLEIQLSGSSTNNARLGIYGFNKGTSQWEYFDSHYDQEHHSISAYLKSIPQDTVYFTVLENMRDILPVRHWASVNVESPVSLSAEPALEGVLLENQFEEGLGSWENRNLEAGASLKIVPRGRFWQGRALELTNQNEGGSFASTVTKQAFDARQYPFIEFDYKITPEVKINFYVKMDGRWYDIEFTDDPKPYPHINIEKIGKIDHVQKDGAWHHARFDLYNMLAAHPPLYEQDQFIIDEMIMADWDVDGFMKLVPGKNPKGARYLIDQFKICSREESHLQRSIIGIERFFSNAFSVNPLWAATSSGVITDGKDAGVLLDLTNTDGQVFLNEAVESRLNVEQVMDKDHKNVLKLDYDVRHPDAYAGYMIDLKHLDLRPWHTLHFWVKGTQGKEIFRVGLKSVNGEETKIITGAFLDKSVSRQWQEVSIPLNAYTGLKDFSSMENLSIIFENGMGSRDSSIQLRNISFTKNLSPMVVADYSNRLNKTIWGLPFWTFEGGTSSIQVFMDRFGCLIHYDGIEASRDNVSWAGWGIHLNQVDASAYTHIRVRMKRVHGMERPHLYLDDGNRSAYVDIGQYVHRSEVWDTVIIPLRDFIPAGINMQKLEKLSLAFEWEKSSGALYIDEIAFEVIPTHSSKV